MIIFTDNFISVSEDHEGIEDSSPTEDLAGLDTSTPEDYEGIEDSSPAEDLAGLDTSASVDFDSKDTSVSSEQSAQGETLQTVTPTIVNDIVVPDNSYSKYCFFFLMLLFALFVGRSFRKGV